MIEKDLFRYERKFILDNYILNNINDLENFLSINLIEKFEERRINSIYYDTPSFKFAFETYDGIAQRQKIRIRYYGSLDKLEFPRLEIKSKIGHVGKKEIIELNKNELYENNFSLIQAYNSNPEKRNILYILFAIEPKVIVTYKRKYFLSSCDKYRFTLDSDISFKKFNINSPKESLNYKFLYPFNKSILELKYKREDEIDASQILMKLPARVSSFSKYLKALYSIGWNT